MKGTIMVGPSTDQMRPRRAYFWKTASPLFVVNRLRLVISTGGKWGKVTSSGGLFTVTHKPSGFAVVEGLTSIADARRFAKWLAKLPMGWETLTWQTAKTMNLPKVLGKDYKRFEQKRTACQERVRRLLNKRNYEPGTR